MYGYAAFQSSRLVAAIVVTTVGMLLLPLSAFPQVAPSPGQFSVRVTVSGTYRNTDEDAKRVDTIGRLLPPTLVNIPAGDTISAFIARQYGFGNSDGLSRIYDVVEKILLDLNGLQRPTDWKPGQRFAPTLPKWAKSDFNPNKIANQISILSESLGALIVGPGDVALPPPPPPVERPNSAPQNQGIDIAGLTDTAAADIMRRVQANSALFAEAPLLLTGSMNVRFDRSDLGSDSPASPLTPDEIERLRSIGAQKPVRGSLLYVLDSCWPDERAYIESVTRLLGILADLRTTNKLGPAFTPSLKPGSFSPPAKGGTHCQDVEASLRFLRAVDGGGVVSVIYVPLSKDQQSEAVLAELLYSHFLVQGVGSGLGVADLNLPVFSDVRKKAKEKVNEALQNIPKVAVGQSLATEKAILDSVMTVANLHARKTRQSYFINESWNVGRSNLFPQYPKVPLGLVVAAVGNSGGVNVYEQEWDFALRSSNADDTIAILNTDRSGEFLCHSNVISFGPASRALAFDGRVGQTTCGTSFSAPRVAWLLAFWEAFQQMPPNPSGWAKEFQMRMLRLRSESDGVTGLVLDVQRYLKQFD